MDDHTYAKRGRDSFFSFSHGGAICAPREFLIRSLFQPTIPLIDLFSSHPGFDNHLWNRHLFSYVFHVFASRSRFSISNEPASPFSRIKSVAKGWFLERCDFCERRRGEEKRWLGGANIIKGGKEFSFSFFLRAYSSTRTLSPAISAVLLELWNLV